MQGDGEVSSAARARCVGRRWRAASAEFRASREFASSRRERARANVASLQGRGQGPESGTSSAQTPKPPAFAGGSGVEAPGIESGRASSRLSMKSADPASTRLDFDSIEPSSFHLDPRFGTSVAGHTRNMRAAEPRDWLGRSRSPYAHLSIGYDDEATSPSLNGLGTKHREHARSKGGQPRLSHSEEHETRICARRENPNIGKVQVLGQQHAPRGLCSGPNLRVLVPC